MVDSLGLGDNSADWAGVPELSPRPRPSTNTESHWPGVLESGVPALTRDELQDGESVNTELSATIAIRASVAAISGSEKEVKNVKTLFHLFGLVPEVRFSIHTLLSSLFHAGHHQRMLTGG